MICSLSVKLSTQHSIGTDNSQEAHIRCHIDSLSSSCKVVYVGKIEDRGGDGREKEDDDKESEKRKKREENQ